MRSRWACTSGHSSVVRDVAMCGVEGSFQSCSAPLRGLAWQERLEADGGVAVWCASVCL